MNIKKYLYVGIGIFVALVLIAIGITSRFNWSNITSDFYGFVEKFFNQWSLALSAAGTIMLALSVFLFIRESRRTQRLTLYDQNLSRIEEWIRGTLDLLLRVDALIIRESTVIRPRILELETEEKTLESEENKLKKEGEKLASKNDTGNAKASDKLTVVYERLEDVTKKLIKVSEEKIEIINVSLENVRKTFDEVVKIGGQHSYAEMVVRPILFLLRDTELNEYFQAHLDLVPKVSNMSIKQDLNEVKKIIKDYKDICQHILARTVYLRSKIYY